MAKGAACLKGSACAVQQCSDLAGECKGNAVFAIEIWIVGWVCNRTHVALCQLDVEVP